MGVWVVLRGDKSGQDGGSSCLIISLSLGLLGGAPHLWSLMGRPLAQISFVLQVLSQPGLGCPQTQHPCPFHLLTLSQGAWERESFSTPARLLGAPRYLVARMCRFRTRKAGASTSLSRWVHLSWLVFASPCPLQCCSKHHGTSEQGRIRGSVCF